MKIRYTLLFHVFSFILSFFAQAQECDINILPDDTIIFATSPQKILLQASDSAEFYYWYENGELVEQAWPSHWVTINPGEEKEITLRVGKAEEENLITNPNFEEGYEGFSVDTLLHQADSLYYGQGQYTIQHSPLDVPHDLQPRYGFSLNQQSNGTNALMITTKCEGGDSHTNHWNTLYSAKIKLEEASYAFFFRIIGSGKIGTGTNGNGLAVSPYYVFIDDEPISFDIYGQLNRGTYPNGELRMSYSQGGVRDFFFFPDNMIHYFLKNRTDLYRSTSTDSIQVEIKVKESSIQSFNKMHYILDSLDLRKICFAEKTIRITVTDSRISIDSLITEDICEEKLPFVFKDSVYTQAGTYSYIVSSALADTVFTIKLRTHQDYNDTIRATICENETYNLHGFHQNTSGTYINRSTSIYGCDSVTVLLLDVEPIGEIEVWDTVFEGMTYTKYGFAVNSSGTYTNYYKINSADDCPTKVTLNLFVIERPTLYVYLPNAFEPEGNTNTVFGYYTDYDNFTLVEFEIFNRWGTRVFSSRKKMDFWDGKYNNVLCPNGMYVYQLLYKSSYTGEILYRKNGEVLLMR